MPFPRERERGAMLVLIVEDDLTIRDLIEQVLHFEHIETLLAGDGQTGVDLALREHPDLVLMDLMLPILDGVSAIKALKRDPATSDIPVVAMSAGTNLRLHADDLPADGVLAKPFDIDALIATVHFQVHHHAHGG